MKQEFSRDINKKFIKHFGIKKYPSIVNINFIEKAKNYIAYIRWIPGLKMIAIGNSVAMNYNTKDSDIDLFIVTKKHRLWLVRILITIIFSLIGVRKTTKTHAGKMCLSFFITTQAMNFENFTIKDDIYLYFWIIYLKPILNYDNTYESFIKENSSWADFSTYKNIIKTNKNYIFYRNEMNYNKSIPEKIKKCLTYPIEKVFSYILDLINYILKIIFLPKTKKKYEKMGKPFGIIINNDILKFHNNDIRKKIKKEILSYKNPKKCDIKKNPKNLKYF